VLLFRPSKDQDVVQVDHHDTFCYEVPEDVVYYGLEGGGTVGHAKEHYQGFKQASIGPEDYLPLVSGLDTDVVETPMDIQLGEVSGSAELQYKFGDEWERVLILDRHRIECSVVLNQLERAVLLLDEEYRGRHRRLRRANLFGTQVLFQERVQLLLFYQRQGVDLR